MSMIGKLRQVSEFDLAKFKKNPGELVRALAGAQLSGDSAGFATLRETLQQSPVVKKMIELRQQQKVLSPQEQGEVQQEMLKLMKQAVQMQKGLAKVPPAEPQSAGRAASEDLDLHKSWHCLHFMLTGKVEGSDGTPLGDAILGGEEIGGDDADTGYGPPRALRPSQVRNVAAALTDFPIDKKAREFDAVAADKAGIYVARHDADELIEYFGRLRTFYDDAARKGNAVLSWIE